MDTIRWQDGEIVFAQAHELATRVYHHTRNFPICEGKGLVYEMRQSTLAVSAFLSDALRKDQKVYLFEVLAVIGRSLAELRRSLAVSRLLTYMSEQDFEALDGRIQALQICLDLWQKDLEDLPSIRPEPEDATSARRLVNPLSRPSCRTGGPSDR